MTNGTCRTNEINFIYQLFINKKIYFFEQNKYFKSSKIKQNNYEGFF